MGTDRATAIKYGLISLENGWDFAQGFINYKRAGTSANIGKAARNRTANGFRITPSTCALRDRK
jgi:hypothetical protein